MANTSFYYDFNFSLPFVEMVMQLLGKKNDVSVQNQLTDTANREWFSQPRVGTSNEVECVTTTFRLPLSVSEISTEILRMPCQLEVWYQDRSNNWRPVLDMERLPLKVIVSRSEAKSWFKYSARCYPIVAKKVQLRITRTNDPVTANIPYPVGLRNTLIRRNVYDRHAGGRFEDEVDIMGNVVSKYIKDWDATRAVDDNYTTFWKSAPQPDPAAVVSLYLDVRSATGAPQTIDRLYLDPVYSGQHLNLYYSSDDTVGTRFVSPITVNPVDALNTEWRVNRGLFDLETGSVDADSYYQWNFNIGPLVRQDCWIGVEWIPGFSDGASLAQNPVLFGSDGVLLSYDSGNSSFVLAVGDSEYSVALSEQWLTGDSLRIVAGWRYTDTGAVVYLRVVDQRDRTIASLTQDVTDLPELISLDGEGGLSRFRGTVANLIVKLESYLLTSASFLKNPTYYCDPDPVLPNDADVYPSTTLDNAVYVAPFISREHGFGGGDRSHFDSKEWTPIWRNYVSLKGMLHFPQPISMKYLKLEFSNLSEEPYPVYESGIEVRYKVFPIQVSQQSSIGPRLYTGQGGFLGLGTFISVNGVRSVNWLDPNSVLTAIGGIISPQVPPVTITTGTPYITDTLPNQGVEMIENSRRVELGSSYVYARDTLQPYVLASDQYNTIIKAEGLQAIQPYVDVPWQEIEAANPGAVTKVKSVGTVPIRGTDWWVYPGQQLKVPASVMKRLTATSTVTERKLTLETRIRFNTTSVHKYEYRTLKRDSSIAYFAGVREVQPYTSTYVVGEDKPVYHFPSYDPSQWVYTNVRQITTGPISSVDASIPGTVFKEITTQSDFSKVSVDFQDSGLVRSNSMWADIDQNVQSIDDTQLSPQVGLIPDGIPTGFWKDFRASWSDQDIVWGSPYALVSINVDNDRRYQGKRVLHFTRAAGEGRAGIKLDQWTNLFPGSQIRVGAVFYRPTQTNNEVVFTLRRSDGVRIHEEALDYAPSGRWYEHTSQFVEIPETLPNYSFDSGLLGWIPAGGEWHADVTTGRTGTKSARLDTNGTDSSLTCVPMNTIIGTTVSCSAWVRWTDLTPGTGTIKLQVVFYNNDDDVVDTIDLGTPIQPDTATATGWSSLSGSIQVPDNQGVTQVAFRLHVDGELGQDGNVWVDDFASDVPGAPRQQYTASITLKGPDEEEIYISNLYSEVSPIRYFVRLGANTPAIEVTDLRYTKDTAIVTSTTPVNQMAIQAAIMTPKAWAFGAKITPHYLK